MKRVIRLLLLGSAIFVAAACAEGDAESLVPEATVAHSSTATEASSAETDTLSTVEAGDFGSRYVGAPVAFWFWAPY
jgi:hypothetical protein